MWICFNNSFFFSFFFSPLTVSFGQQCTILFSYLLTLRTHVLRNTELKILFSYVDHVWKFRTMAMFDGKNDNAYQDLEGLITRG